MTEAKGSMLTPTWAMCDMELSPNIIIDSWVSISCSFLRDDILKIAEGFWLLMWPRYCHFDGELGSGQLQYTAKNKNVLKQNVF